MINDLIDDLITTVFVEQPLALPGSANFSKAVTSLIVVILGITKYKNNEEKKEEEKRRLA